MPVSGKMLIRELVRAGFVVRRISGSHFVLVKEDCVVVDLNHNRDLSKGTEMAIRKKTGVYR